MNTYITKKLAQVKTSLSTEGSLNNKAIDALIGELEMVKMEIEQHISNMPRVPECKASLFAAENTVKKLTEILVLTEELNDVSDADYQDILDEMFILIDDINY